MMLELIVAITQKDQDICSSAMRKDSVVSISLSDDR